MDKTLEIFQSRDLTTNEWNKLFDQALTRLQKSAEDILKSTYMGREENKNIPPGFSDESGDSDATVRRSERHTKNKGPSRYGNPVKHSVELITSQQHITDLNKAALEAYRTKLATFRADVTSGYRTGLTRKTCF